MRKRRSGHIAINPVPPYIPNTPKGAGLTDMQGRPLLSFYLIKPAKKTCLFVLDHFSRLPKIHASNMSMRV